MTARLAGRKNKRGGEGLALGQVLRKRSSAAWFKKVVFGVTRLEFAGQLAKGGFGQITAANLAKPSADATPTPISTCAGVRRRRGLWPNGACAGQTPSAERNGAYSGCYPHRNHAIPEGCPMPPPISDSTAVTPAAMAFGGTALPSPTST